MKGVNARFLIAAILLAGSSSAGPTLASGDAGRPAYIVTNLPSLGGAVSSGNSLNDLGWSSGTSNLSGDITQHATLWLERPEGGVAWNTPMAINEWGDVVGFSNVSAGD